MQRILGYMRKAIQEFDLIQNGDRIAVGVSGGKDSVALLVGLARLRRFIGIDYEVVGLTLDPQFGGMPGDYSAIEALCKELAIPYVVKQTQIGEIVFDARQESNPCSLCARMRRGALHDTAKELGCNKIALGHHFSDVIETTLLGLFYGAQMQSMPPKLHSKNFPGMELIRPLYCVHEEDIIAWKNYNGLRFLQCACRFTEERDAAEDGVGQSKRQEMKRLIRTLRETNPNIEKSIFAAIHDVQIDTLAGCKFAGRRYAFTEYYDKLGQGGEENS